MLNKKKMAGRVPLENVSEEKKKMDARGSDDGSEFSKLRDCKKNEPPGRKITLKINKWALS
jgi:hypothetical protein